MIVLIDEGRTPRMELPETPDGPPYYILYYVILYYIVLYCIVLCITVLLILYYAILD